MILSFKTKNAGKPTYFVEKIHSGLLQNELLQGFDLGDDHEFDLDVLCSCEPKIHTLREDLNDRWKVGLMIDFFINARQKNMFRFGPKIPVVRTQKVNILEMDWARTELCYHTKKEKIFSIIVDGVRLTTEQIEVFSKNDGFDNAEHFFEWFSSDWSGKLIHWTDFRYGL